MTVASRAPPAIESDTYTTASSAMSGRPSARPGGVKRPRMRAMSSTPPATTAKYATATIENASHLPSTMLERWTGLLATVCTTPVAISPESVSTGSSTAVMSVRKCVA